MTDYDTLSLWTRRGLRCRCDCRGRRNRQQWRSIRVGLLIATLMMLLAVPTRLVRRTYEPDGSRKRRVC